MAAMRLWTRIRKLYLQDWRICSTCERTIPNDDWSWFHKKDECWHCHPCARVLQTDLLSNLVLMSQREKQAASLESSDETFWIAICLIGLMWLALVIVMAH